MRRIAGVGLSVLLLVSAPALSASAATSGLCGSRSNLSATTPYNDDSLLLHLVSARGSLACGPYSSTRQWKVKVTLEQYIGGSWRTIASATSGWRAAKSGTVTSGAASVNCLVGVVAYKFRAHATGYLRTSSRGATTTIGSTYSSSAVRYC